MLRVNPSGGAQNTGINALAADLINKYHVKIEYVFDLPTYKAIATSQDPTGAMYRDTRFLPAAQLPGIEYTLQVKNGDLRALAAEIGNTPGNYPHHIVDLPNFKAISLRAEPNSKFLTDPRFAVLEQDDHEGHVAQLASSNQTVIRWNQTIPDGIKRTIGSITTTGNISSAALGSQLPQIAPNAAQPITGLGASSNNNNNIVKSIPTGALANTSSGRTVDADIAILDTGISLHHRDLNVYRNVSFAQGTTSGNDDNGHGSHVAGIAAAKDNSIGIVGSAPGARLWAIKVCDASGGCQVSNEIKGIEYAIKHANEIDVINISIENTNSPALNAIIKEAVKAGITVVASAGNWGKDASTFSPANSPDVLTVSAMGDSDGKCGGTGPPLALKWSNQTVPDDSFAWFSNYGPSVKVAAPGVNIFSTWKDNGYGVDSGTSMAAPYVSGAAALFKSESAAATPSQIKTTIEAAGSGPNTVCNGGPRGYFIGDSDGIHEPLLFGNFVGNFVPIDKPITSTQNNVQPISGSKQIQPSMLHTAGSTQP
jgi:Subtilase family